MYRVPIRWLIVALALALQTLASGFGAGSDGRLLATGELGGTLLCLQSRGGPDRHAPPVGGHGHSATACLSCEACLAGFSPIPTHVAGKGAPSLRGVAKVEWASAESRAARPAHAGSQRARAPPPLV
jgi:hypothetical protein